MELVFTLIYERLNIIQFIWDQIKEFENEKNETDMFSMIRLKKKEECNRILKEDKVLDFLHSRYDLTYREIR